jgi:hypothetical protein
MLDKREVRETLVGYARANEAIEEERRIRLQSMTAEDAFRIYQDLCATAMITPLPQDEAERLEQWRLETLLNVRRVFDAAARRRNAR